jgi:hypothetical protein
MKVTLVMTKISITKRLVKCRKLHKNLFQKVTLIVPEEQSKISLTLISLFNKPRRNWSSRNQNKILMKLLIKSMTPEKKEEMNSSKISLSNLE